MQCYRDVTWGCIYNWQAQESSSIWRIPGDCYFQTVGPSTENLVPVENVKGMLRNSQQNADRVISVLLLSVWLTCGACVLGNECYGAANEGTTANLIYCPMPFEPRNYTDCCPNIEGRPRCCVPESATTLFSSSYKRDLSVVVCSEWCECWSVHFTASEVITFWRQRELLTTVALYWLIVANKDWLIDK